MPINATVRASLGRCLEAMTFDQSIRCTGVGWRAEARIPAFMRVAELP
jgi:hypothetical protein